MKKSFLFTLSFLTLTSVAFVSCKKDEAPGVKGAKVSYQFNSIKGSSSVRGRVMSTLTFNSGFIKISEIEFSALDANTNQRIAFSAERLSTVDYVSGMCSPEITDTIPAGNYKDVKLSVEIYDDVDAPSIVMEGVFTKSNGSQVPVRFEFNSGEVFEASAAQISLADNTAAIAKIKFDPHYWFSTVSAEELENAVLTNGKILINERKNAELFSKIADKLDDATQATF